MHDVGNATVPTVIARLLLAAALGGLSEYGWRQHRRLSAIIGMAMVAAGASGFLLLARQMGFSDSTAVSRALETCVLVVSLIATGVIVTRGIGPQSIKTGATIWVMGAVGLTIATEIWWVGVIVGLVTVLARAAAARLDQV